MKLMFSMPTLTKGKGGAERVATELANEMSLRGHEVTIYSCTKEGDTTLQYPLAPGVAHVCIPLLEAERVRQVIRDIDPDLFFMFYTGDDLLPQYALIADMPIPVGGQECTNPVRAVDNIFRRSALPDIETAYALRRAVLSGMHGIRMTMESYPAFLPAIAKPSCHAFNNAFAPAKARADVVRTGGRKRIINVGGLKAPNKNGQVLALAFAQIAENFPDWDLCFFGGGSEDTVQAITRRSGLEGRIWLGGTTDDIYAQYAQSQVHVICSFEEGCPNVVCEAMLHGLPSIGFSDCRGTNELIRDGVNGLLVSREDEVNSLARGLERLMSDAAARQKMGAAAYDEAIERFDVQKTYDRWEDLLRHMAAYKGDAARLYREQCVLHAEDAAEMRRVRTQFLNQYGGGFFYLGGAIESEKITTRPWPKVSIIIPVFNKGKYIAETIHSVMACDYPDKEIIAVDDCSTDESLSILKKLEAEHGNMKVVQREKNGGLSAARNTGLDHATGVYVSFWDADDLYDRQGLSEIIDVMEKDCSDIGTGLAVREGKMLDHYRPANFLARRTTFQQTPAAFSTNSTCFKIYRRSFLEKNGLRFVEGLYVQDMEFNLRAFALSRLVSVTPFVLGEYRLVEDSWGRSLSRARVASTFKIGELTENFLKENNLLQFEAFRQKQVLKFVFIFFIRRLLGLKKEGMLGEYVEDFERFRNTLLSYQTGVEELSRTEPFWAAAMVAFCSGHDDLALRLFSDKNRADCAPLYHENAFNLSREEIEAFFERPAKCA